MTTQKLLMFAVAGALVPTAAHAARGVAKVTEVIPAPTQDLAPTTGTGETELLKMTDSEQPGNEMAAVVMFKDGVHGLYFSMNTELNGVLANDRIQLAMVPFALTLDAADGGVAATPDMATAKYITNNNGNQYRNAHHPAAYQINDGSAACVEYNFQPNNTNNTKRYMQCYSATGAQLMPQTQIYAKTNDDCSMDKDGAPTAKIATVDGKINRFGAWRGCNGNGDDDGWYQGFTVSCNDAASPTSCTFKQDFDVSVCPREERSRGTVIVADADPNTAYAAWTEGNTQPQRDGTWIAAIDVTPGAHTGNNQQGAILWKQQIEGRIESGGLTTYSMRAMMTNIMEVAQTPTAGIATGGLVRTNKVLWRSGDLRGNNNNNNKGGTYYRNKMAVMQLTRAGLSYVMPMTDVADTLDGLDGTHLGMTTGLFGEEGNLTAGVAFLTGSHTGGGTAAAARVALYDAATNTIKDGTSYGIGPYDRHLYPNYLGNNPSTQGRNFSAGQMIANPFFDATHLDQYLMLFATTGKSTANMSNPKIKLSAFLSVLPIASAKTPAPVTPDPTPNPNPNPNPTPNPDPMGTDGSNSLGGCSTSNTTGGMTGFLVLGLAGLLRRRRA